MRGGTKEKHEDFQLEQPVSEARYHPEISPIRSCGATLTFVPTFNTVFTLPVAQVKKGE